MCTTPQSRAPSGFFKYDIFKTSWYKTLKECERKVENFTTQADKSMKNQHFCSTARIFLQKREKLIFFTQVFRCGKENKSRVFVIFKNSPQKKRTAIITLSGVFGRDSTDFTRLCEKSGKSLATFSFDKRGAQEILAICLQIGGVQPPQNLHLLALASWKD